MLKKLNQKGVTLLETILVMSLIAIIMIGGLNLYRGANEKTKVNEAVREITGLSTGIRSLYASSADFGGSNPLDNQVVIDSGAAPKGMRIVGNTIMNVFDGSVTVSPEDHQNGATDAVFSIEYGNLSKSACVELASTDLDAANVGNVGLSHSLTADLSPASPGSAVALCPTETGNTLVWIFGN